MSQLTLTFPHQPDYSVASLLPTSGTEAARQALAANTHGVVCLFGGEGSGKTHLLHVWAAAQDAALVSAAEHQPMPASPYPDAFALDDLDQLQPDAQQQLFHLFNAYQSPPEQLQRRALVVTSNQPVASLNLLPDLKSRLLLGLQIELLPPTATELAQLAQKWAAERQLALPDDVVAYLLSRAERSATVLRGLVLRLDALSLEQRRGITVSLARQVLEQFLAETTLS